MEPGKLDSEGRTRRMRNHRGRKSGRTVSRSPAGGPGPGVGASVSRITVGSRQRTGRWVCGLSNREIKGDLEGADLGGIGDEGQVGWIPG